MTVEGQVVHELDTDALYAMRRRMGMMFQVSGLFSDIAVFENIAFALREHYVLPEDLIQTLVLMKLHAVGLRGAHALMPSDLSGGMARRVALARAIAVDPMIAMYDEPFAGYDPISLNVIAQLIRKSPTARQHVDRRDYEVSEALEKRGLHLLIAEGVVEGTALRADEGVGGSVPQQSSTPADGRCAVLRAGDGRGRRLGAGDFVLRRRAALAISSEGRSKRPRQCSGSLMRETV